MNIRHNNAFRDQNRHGFSMIEILVTVGIILLLMGILLPTLRGVISNAKETRTKTTLTKLHSMIKQARIEFDSTVRRGKQQVPNNLQGVGLSENAIQLLSRKLKYKQAFPQRFEDLVGFDGLPGTLVIGSRSTVDDDNDGNTDYDSGRPDIDEFGLGNQSDDSALARIVLRKIADGTFDPSLHTEETESAELFYLLITEGSVFGVTTADFGEFEANELKDTDGDGLLEIVDAWEHPLRFYRWPTRLVSPPKGIIANRNPYWDLLSSTNFNDLPVQTDPQDQQLTYTTEIMNFAPALFSEGTDNLNLQNVLHTPGIYHTFLIVSAGPDGKLGLEEPSNYTLLGHLAAPLESILDAVDLASTTEEKEAVVYDSVLNDNLTNLQLDVP